MKIIGLTGLTGAGKSTVAQRLMAYGCYHIDADKVARNVINNNENVKNKLKARFGEDVVNSDGTINRPVLASRAFADEDSTNDLNSITHPAVTEEIQSIIKDMKEVGYRAVIIDAIALFESGEDALCGICTEHPRFYNEFSESVECGLGLCCEEVCRLLLETDEPCNYVTEIVPEDEISIGFYLDESVHEDYIAIYTLRAEMFEILNSDLSFDDKINGLKGLVEKAINEKIVLDSDGAILARYDETEPINSEWTEYFNSLKDNICVYLEKEKPFDEATNGDKLYSKILSYIIFRHLGSCLYNESSSLGECLSFCVSAVRFIKLCDMKTYHEKGTLTLSDRIENVKRWSKQIEYSDLNVDMLTK
jgi:hypothetical protein